MLQARVWGMVGVLLCAASARAFDGGASSLIQSRLGVTDYQVQDLVIERGRPYCVSVVLGGVPCRLVLEPRDLRAAGFRVRVSDSAGGLREVPVPPVTTYRGVVDGHAGSWVEASIVGDRVTATVCLGQSAHRTFSIQPLDGLVPGVRRSPHVVYRLSEAEPQGGGCVLADAGVPWGDEARVSAGAGGVAAVATMRVCEIACDADYEYYVLNNESIEETLADVEAVINAVSALYERDLQIGYTMTEVIIRTDESDPYTETAPEPLLWQFRDQWQAHHTDVVRDVAHLFTGRDLAGTPIGVAFGTPGICSLWSGYSVAQSHFTDQWVGRVTVTAHELGHNFDAGHCDWGDWWCRIMCTTNGGCAGRNSFGPTSVEQISDYAATCACLSAGAADLPEVSLPFYDGFDYPWDLDATLWTGVDGAYPSTTGGIEPSPARSAQINEYDTFRSHPMVVDRPVSISYWTNHKGVEASSGAYGKSLKVEFFDSSSWRWQTLETVTSDGMDTADFVYHEHALPVEGVGDHFALRFTGYGSFAEYNDKWFVDDVRVRHVHAAGDVDADDAFSLGDVQAFVACLGGVGVGVPPTECDTLVFDRADLEGDGDVDLRDFQAFQHRYGAAVVCGDGWLGAGEWCDDVGASLYCNDDCTLSFCGDGKVNAIAGEACDDGGASADCDPDCTLAVCGDGYVNVAADEACDDAGESYACDSDCTPAGCGDGTTNVTRGEECDDGAQTAYCDANCTLAVCGDHYVNQEADELCDEGGETAGCDDDCTWPVCGDGVVNEAAGEACDDGNTVGGDGCSARCTLGEPLPTCVVSFDDGCLSDQPMCGVRSVVGEPVCMESPTFCVHTEPDLLDLEASGGFLELEFDGDVHTLSIAFWGEWVDYPDGLYGGGPGPELSGGWIEFLDADDMYVAGGPSNSCPWGVPEPVVFTFDSPVRRALVYMNMPPAWVDTIVVNP